MGAFEVTVGVGRIDASELTPVIALVDTGASHSMMPESFLRGLGVRPLESFLYSVADGRQVEIGYGMARLGFEGREFPCPIIFSPDEQYLFGATSLQTFNLKVDPVEERLERRVHRARSI